MRRIMVGGGDVGHAVDYPLLVPFLTAVAYGMIDKVLEKRLDAPPAPSPERPA